ncbi:MAG TPA: protein kinase [Opitutaceae bacterium]
MNATRHGEEELFDAAREMTDPQERRSFLERTCKGDSALRTRIDTLLSAEAEAERFFSEGSSAMSLPGSVAPPSWNSSTSSEAVASTRTDEESVGTRIGRYKLVQKIGEGGCGVVYMAEQEEPVRRRVALKIIKLGMETKSVVARFEAERQALAMMDHPNIARVFDAGATEGGSPYFVMELVRGVRITKYCDKNHLNIRQRLDLFIQICHAIQHAHQKGIIHRDIKPSNIMVALHDGVPVPKVIDFGISKATDARLSDRLSFTAYAQLMGTPDYMSPEQADTSGLDIDTRSDIYSLGVLLYELLTSKTPFDTKELLGAGMDDFRRTLRERAPPKPSDRLLTIPRSEVAAAAESRLTDPSALYSMLRDDLDWVVMKALEKDHRRRYETANGLAMDIQRHLSCEPVTAHPHSGFYQFRKLVRRNRVVFATGGAVALALVVGLGTSTWLFLKERDARQRAVTAEQQQAHLRVEAEGRAKMTQAALLVSQEKFADADRLVNEIPMDQPTVEGAAVLRAVGEWHAVQGRWKLAADRLTRLVQVDSLDGWDVSTLDDLRLGPAFVEMGDSVGYERFRDDALARFLAAPSPAADRILKISLLLPADERALASLKPVAAGTARSFAESDANGDVFKAAWDAMSLALWEYRNGNFARAVDWSQRCLSSTDKNGPRSAAALAIIAMSDQKLGRTIEAGAQLLAGEELVEGRQRGRLDLGLGTPVQGFWFDRALARILLRESKGLIDPHSTWQ